MLGAASVILEPMEGYYRSYALEYYPAAEQEVRACLGEQEFTRAWQSGKQSPQAVIKMVEESGFDEPSAPAHD
jgi:hypothetical protein